MIESRKTITPADTHPLFAIDLRGKLPTGGAYKRRRLSEIHLLIIHHSGPPGWIPGVNAVSYAFRIARCHLRHKWPGIGYHFLIGGAGMICHCNGLEMISYHTTDHNSPAVGICFLGNFMPNYDVQPSPLQLTAGRALLAWLRALLPGTETVGHRDVIPSACPGHTWPEWSLKLTGGGS